jgi:hypothetical protein
MRAAAAWTALAGGLASALAACSPSGVVAPSSVPVQGSGCVTQQQAEQIWTGIDAKLNAIVLDPMHRGADAVSTGNALVMLNQYIQQQLVSNGFTEREVDRLAQLTIVDPGCNGGALRIRVAVTIVQDDYLAQDGHVDHKDLSVGSIIHVLETFSRVGSIWKESDFQDLDVSSPSPQLVSASGPAHGVEALGYTSLRSI